MKGPGFSRRSLLAGTAASLALAGVIGGAALADRAGLLRRILVRLLGPFEMAEAEFARFVADLEGTIPLPGSWESDLLHVAEFVPGEAVGGLFADLADRRENMERRLLSEFMLATGITGRPEGRRLEYLGLFAQNPCANPYARFS